MFLPVPLSQCVLSVCLSHRQFFPIYIKSILFNVKSWYSTINNYCVHIYSGFYADLSLRQAAFIRFLYNSFILLNVFISHVLYRAALSGSHCHGRFRKQYIPAFSIVNIKNQPHVVSDQKKSFLILLHIDMTTNNIT